MALKWSIRSIWLMSPAAALRSLFLRPGDTLLRRWNWKSALFSSVVRGLIFLFANLKSGWHAAVGAMAAEWVFRALTSGFYGAMTEALSDAEPPVQAAVVAMIALPIASHSMEFMVHFLRGTPNLKVSIVSSMCFTAISTLFNFYAMRRGAIRSGDGAQSIGEDIKAMPRLVAEFVAAGPLWMWRRVARKRVA
jgi:hypothetical protein